MNACGCVPSQAEIGRHFGYKSPNATRQNLKLIEKKGYIKLLPGVARGIRLLKRNPSRTAHSVPLIGRIAAGYPTLAEQNVEDWIQVPRCLFPKVNGRFALRVEGDSMMGAGILDGDFAVIRKQPTAESGTIAAVRIGSEATLKRIDHHSGGLRLKAEHPQFEEVEIVSDLGVEVEIEGILEGIIRSISKGGAN